MRKFAYLTNPINPDQLKDFKPRTWMRLPFLGKALYSRVGSFDIFSTGKARSDTGEEINGHVIVLPLLPEKIKQLTEKELLEKVGEALDLAQALGCGILGLGGIFSFIGDEIFHLKKKIRLPLTAGSALSAWAAFEALFHTAKAKEVNLKECCVAVIGADSAVGSLCSRQFAGYAAKLNLYALNQEKLERLKEEILSLGQLKIDTFGSVLSAIEAAEVVIFAEDLTQPNLSLETLKVGALVCDVSCTKTIAGRLFTRPDVILVEGDWVKLPYPLKFGPQLGPESDIIPAALAETMLLAFDGKLTNYSLGDNVNLDKMPEIADLAVQHGLEVWAPDGPVL